MGGAFNYKETAPVGVLGVMMLFSTLIIAEVTGIYTSIKSHTTASQKKSILLQVNFLKIKIRNDIMKQKCLIHRCTSYMLVPFFF